MKINITYEVGDRVQFTQKTRNELGMLSYVNDTFEIAQMLSNGWLRLQSETREHQDVVCEPQYLEPAPDLAVCATALLDAINLRPNGRMPYSTEDRRLVLARWCIAFVKRFLGLDDYWTEDWVLNRLQAEAGDLYALMGTSVKKMIPPAEFAVIPIHYKQLAISPPMSNRLQGEKWNRALHEMEVSQGLGDDSASLHGPDMLCD